MFQTPGPSDFDHRTSEVVRAGPFITRECLYEIAMNGMRSKEREIALFMTPSPKAISPKFPASKFHETILTRNIKKVSSISMSEESAGN